MFNYCKSFTAALTAAALLISSSAQAFEKQEENSNYNILASNTQNMKLKLPFFSAYRLNEAKFVRSSFNDEKLRIVINTELESQFQVSTDNLGKTLIVDLLDTKAEDLRLPALPKSQNLKSWSVKKNGLDALQLTVNLNYPIGGDSIKAFSISDPNRLVIDINTAYNADETCRISPGITWKRQTIKDASFGILLWNQLTFDRKDPNVTIDVAFPSNKPGKTAKLSSIVPESKSIAGINGGFFNMTGGEILGVAVKDGKIISPHVGRRPARSVFAVTKDNDLFIERIKVLNGKAVNLSGKECPPLRIALGAGPSLLKNGKLNITASEEQLGPGGNDITRACGRSAVAYNKDTIMLAALSGSRDSHSQGWKLPAMAKYLIKKGMTDALNLDGGGSVDMAVDDHIVANGPQAGSYERPIATALVLKDSRGASYPSSIQIDIPDKMDADGVSSAKAILKAFSESGKPAADGFKIKLQGKGLNCPSYVTIKDGKAEFEIISMRGSGNAVLTAYTPFSKASANTSLKTGRASSFQVRVNSIKTEQTAYASAANISENTESSKDSEQKRAASVKDIYSKAVKALQGSKSADADKLISKASYIAEKIADIHKSASLKIDSQSFYENVYPALIDINPEFSQKAQELKESLKAQESENQQTALVPSSLPPSLSSRMRNIDLDIAVKDQWHNSIPNSAVTVYDESGKLSGSGISGKDGILHLSLKVPESSGSIRIKAIGLEDLVLNLNGTPKFSE